MPANEGDAVCIFVGQEDYRDLIHGMRGLCKHFGIKDVRFSDRKMFEYAVGFCTNQIDLITSGKYALHKPELLKEDLLNSNLNRKGKRGLDKKPRKNNKG